METLIISCLISGLFAVVLGALYAARYATDRAIRERFDEVAIGAKTGEPPAGEPLLPRDHLHSALRWASERMPKPKKTASVAKVSQTLVRAGFMRSSAVRMFQAVRLLSLISGSAIGLLGALAMRYPEAKVVMYAGIGTLAGGYLPNYYLQRRARARQAAIARQLSDVLDLLVVCVEAGLGLFEAIKIIGDETGRQGQEIGDELTLVAREVAAGSSLGDALRNFGDRTAVEDIRPLAATLIQSEQLGAQIAPALRSSSDALRAKRRMRAEEAAQKSTIKILFPLVLFVLPAMLVVILAPAMIQAVHTLSL
jgi:tight adherence protein C